ADPVTVPPTLHHAITYPIRSVASIAGDQRTVFFFTLEHANVAFLDISRHFLGYIHPWTEETVGIRTEVHVFDFLPAFDVQQPTMLKEKLHAAFTANLPHQR